MPKKHQSGRELIVKKNVPAAISDLISHVRQGIVLWLFQGKSLLHIELTIAAEKLSRILLQIETILNAIIICSNSDRMAP